MIELVQFRASPYNEKVRWALDLKRVPHRRRSVLPGPHLWTVRRLTGRTTTPVLLADGRAIDGSAAILAWIDEHHPDPPLLPATAADRSQAQEIQFWFDDDIIPRVRRVVLDALLRSPMYFAEVFAAGRPLLVRRAYGALVPLAAPLIRRGNGIAGADSVTDGHIAAHQALHFVATRGAATGYLVGERFSLADLTAASALATLVRPPHSPMASPQPVAPAFQALLDRYADHPGAEWVRRIYREHRGALRDFDGPNPLPHTA